MFGKIGFAAMSLAAFSCGPGEAAPGSRRITQQFEAWSLTCVEEAAAKRKTCGAAQEIFGAGGAPAFRWDLVRGAAGALQGEAGVPRAL